MQEKFSKYHEFLLKCIEIFTQKSLNIYSNLLKYLLKQRDAYLLLYNTRAAQQMSRPGY